jgi:hypothetical protein
MILLSNLQAIEKLLVIIIQEVSPTLDELIKYSSIDKDKLLLHLANIESYFTVKNSKYIFKVEKEENKKDLVDGYLEMLSMPGLKKEVIKTNIAKYLKEKFKGRVIDKPANYRDLVEFLTNRQLYDKYNVEKFFTWVSLTLYREEKEYKCSDIREMWDVWVKEVLEKPNEKLAERILGNAD